MIPGPRYWAFVEKGRVEDNSKGMPYMTVASVLFIATSLIEIPQDIALGLNRENVAWQILQALAAWLWTIPTWLWALAVWLWENKYWIFSGIGVVIGLQMIRSRAQVKGTAA